MQNFNFHNIVVVPHWLWLVLVYIVWVSVWLIVKKIFFQSFKTFASRTATKIDDILILAAQFPLTLIIFTSGGMVVERMLPDSGIDPAHQPSFLAFKVVMIIAIILFVDGFAIGLIRTYSPKFEILKSSESVSQGIAHAIFLGIGSLVILDSCGISITPVLASLGIGSLAVALALQPTLENLFSGVQIVTDKPVQLGQLIKLETGEEGYVTKIGWRSTWIRLPSNNTVIVPNKILANSRILNYYYPDKESILVVTLGVHYHSDLDHVERVTLDVARQVMREVSGGVKTFEPVIVFGPFASFSITMNVVLQVREFSVNGLVQSEFIKRLHKRYKEEGIVIPYPVQAVNFSQEKAATCEQELKDSPKG